MAQSTGVLRSPRPWRGERGEKFLSSLHRSAVNVFTRRFSPYCTIFAIEREAMKNGAERQGLWFTAERWNQIKVSFHGT